MTAFSNYSATKNLKKLAKEVVDLSKEGTLTSKRIERMSMQSLGLKLLYGTERVTDKVLETLFDLAKEAKAIHKMKAMQNGEVINLIKGFESENRSVLHTAMRDFFDRSIETDIAKEASKEAYCELEKLRYFLKEIDNQDFTDLIQIV